jgi:2-oxo-4-hydroxy-4-carboxy-5-ureidoimidazoline decarboxylase
VSDALHRLDTMPAAAAADLLRACCGAARWVERMTAARPFNTEPALRESADRIWRSLDRSDWLEAFSHHPRIGEQRSAVPTGTRAGAWSSGEQSSVAVADAGVRESLAAANREYESRFGYIYIVCATGRTAHEMLALARERLTNEPAHELTVAAEEQRKITQLRLGKLLHDLEDG